MDIGGGTVGHTVAGATLARTAKEHSIDLHEGNAPVL